jgi:hypothetical protein
VTKLEAAWLKLNYLIKNHKPLLNIVNKHSDHGGFNRDKADFN